MGAKQALRRLSCRSGAFRRSIVQIKGLRTRPWGPNRSIVQIKGLRTRPRGPSRSIVQIKGLPEFLRTDKGLKNAFPGP
jgi:hypothetical protein